uniref:Secreted protein n=1 Tax=Caenorhabditis tropicalis TaxID=1561998 RepID=A0A1I7T7W6_9PELO
MGGKRKEVGILLAAFSSTTNTNKRRTSMCFLILSFIWNLSSFSMINKESRSSKMKSVEGDFSNCFQPVISRKSYCSL